MIKYHIETDKQKIDEQMEGYFWPVDSVNLKKALMNFSNKEGFGIEFVELGFKSDYDDFDLA